METEWYQSVALYKRTCAGLRRTDDFTADVISVGRNSERDSNSITFGMSRVSLCILIMAIVVIIALPLHHIYEKAHSSFYYCVGHITTWLNGVKRWVT